MTNTFGSGNADTVDGYHASQLLTPVGTVVDYAGSTAPSGWLLCYGQAVSRTTYSALYAIIGTTYGTGDGSTTFNLPDVRGRVIAGKDDMGGTSANRLTNQTGGLDGDVLGANGGAETHTLTEAQMPSHKHDIYQWVGDYQAGAINLDDIPGSGNHNTGSTVPFGTGTNNTGGGGAHNNVQPTLIFNKIIRAT
jgi:microcystin-dependent protein